MLAVCFLPLLLIREPIISHYSENMGEAVAQLNSKVDMRQNLKGLHTTKHVSYAL